VVGERPVELRVQHLELDRRQPGEHHRDDEAAHAVGGVGDDRQGSQGRDVDEGADVVGEVLQQVLLAALPPPGCLGGAATGQFLDPLQPGVLAHRARTRAAQLDAVVLGRVV
jgi:hypothetical protein